MGKGARAIAWVTTWGKRTWATVVAIGVVVGILSWLGIQGRDVANKVADSLPFVSHTACSGDALRAANTSDRLAFSVEVSPRKSGTCWSPALAPVDPGSTIYVLFGFQAVKQSTEQGVAVRVGLPKDAYLIPGSTRLYTSFTPDGVDVGTNAVVTNGGMAVGAYKGPGGGGFVMFGVALPNASELTCGINRLWITGGVRADGVKEVQRSAEVGVWKRC